VTFVISRESLARQVMFSGFKEHSYKITPSKTYTHHLYILPYSIPLSLVKKLSNKLLILILGNK